MRKTGNPILDRIGSINPTFVEDRDLAHAPTDPVEFLEWWWETQAAACDRCILSERRNKVVKPDGKYGAKIMIIGEGPGFLEDLAGLPLIGPLELRASECGTCRKVMSCFSNSILHKVNSRMGPRKSVDCLPDPSANAQLPPRPFYLRSAGSIFDGIMLDKWKFTYPRNNWVERYNALHPNAPWEHESPWYITNTIMCRSTDAVRMANAEPPAIAKQRCKRHLTFQWAALQPKIVVCLGQHAREVLAGSEAKAKLIPRGQIIETKFGPTIYDLHPAHFMREQQREYKGYAYAKIGETLAKALEFAGYPV